MTALLAHITGCTFISASAPESGSTDPVRGPSYRQHAVVNHKEGPRDPDHHSGAPGRLQASLAYLPPRLYHDCRRRHCVHSSRSPRVAHSRIPHHVPSPLACLRPVRNFLLSRSRSVRLTHSAIAAFSTLSSSTRPSCFSASRRPSMERFRTSICASSVFGFSSTFVGPGSRATSLRVMDCRFSRQSGSAALAS